MNTTLYPPSPAVDIKKLTALPSSYKLKASLAILAIVLFFVLYVALLVALGYLVKYTIELGGFNFRYGFLIKLGAIAGSVMLLLFTLKFIFKLKNHKVENRIELSKKDYPELWSFVDKICADTKAPKPVRIYADPDVNAYVRYSNMWLSLFLPVKKELTIGLGLVSCLNLSEFKAVISHEFGHFAQRSMKIGSYIISANTIIHDMIYSRDKFDEILDQWRSADLRLSAAAWAITPLIWIIRQVLALFYQFLNIMYSSLSREMEFNADKVAVSTSGSEAIISALWKLDPGFESWSTITNHAYMASNKGIGAENLYVHNDSFLAKGSDKIKEKLKALPRDENGTKTFFASSEQSKTSMYASHPPNDKREANAINPVIECDIDERSPWLLFDNKEALQKEMTALIYTQYLNKENLDLKSEEEFGKFIEAETLDLSLEAEYHNNFQNRFFNVADKEVLEEESAALTKVTKENIEGLKAEVFELMKPAMELDVIIEKAQNISQGATKEKFFEYDGVKYNKRNLEEGFKLVFDKREAIYKSDFVDWDKKFCSHHLHLADQKGLKPQLLKLYNQHRILASIFKHVAYARGFVFEEINILQQLGEVTEAEVRKSSALINTQLKRLNELIETITEDMFVPLPNIDSFDELKQAITEKGVFIPGGSNIFGGEVLNRIINDLEQGFVHCHRLDNKSINEILKFHKSML